MKNHFSHRLVFTSLRSGARHQLWALPIGAARVRTVCCVCGFPILPGDRSWTANGLLPYSLCGFCGDASFTGEIRAWTYPRPGNPGWLAGPPA